MTSWHERVNVRGERIALPLKGPLGQAAWMKDRIAHADLHKTRAIAKTQPPDGGRRRGCSCSGPEARVMTAASARHTSSPRTACPDCRCSSEAVMSCTT
jgi:hypothetical protein